eukprot:scaffold368430_cov59-Attheya_sp.AAC.3
MKESFHRIEKAKHSITQKCKRQDGRVSDCSWGGIYWYVNQDSKAFNNTAVLQEERSKARWWGLRVQSSLGNGAGAGLPHYQPGSSDRFDSIKYRTPMLADGTGPQNRRVESAITVCTLQCADPG